MGWSDAAARNRESWSRANIEYTGPRALEKWWQDEITWGYASPEWARKWPAEEIWVARER